MKVLTLVLCFFLCLPAIAQNETPELTLENIYSHNVLDIHYFGPVRWLKDGKSYAALEKNSVTNASDIVRYDAKSGKRSIMVASQDLLPQGSDQALSIRDYQWSDDNSKVLLFCNTTRVWRYHTRGDYWVYNPQAGTLQQLGADMPKSSLMFAKFSPQGDRVAYVCENNVYVEHLANGKRIALTNDGNKHIVNGTFDWVYEEEFDCRDGFRWSPDGSKIAYWQSNTEGTGTFYMVNTVDSVYSQLIPLPYPKAGTTNSAVKVGVVSADGGETQWLDIPGDPRNNYIPRMDFIPNSNELMIQQFNRLQNTNKIWVANASNGSLNNILTESEDTWVDVHDNIQWLKNNQFFTWTSERSGYRHLYMVSRDGNTVTPITKGDFDVVSIQRIDEKGGYVYYTASPQEFYRKNLYRSRLNGKGPAERMTPTSFVGHSNYQISPSAKYAIHRFNNSSTPTITSLVSLPAHKQVRMFEDNAAAKARYDAWGLQSKEFIKVDIGSAILDAWVIKPRDFDASKKYPSIFYVYGEPYLTEVQDQWKGSDLWHQYMAQQGYVIVCVDNRGTKVPRGKKFRKCIYGQVGELAVHDQADAARKIAEEYSYIDAARLGIWGWSGGGSMTLNCMFRYSDVYKTGIAVAAVSDQRIYNTIYQERYMGLPSVNTKGYVNGSPITHASKLEGNLMLIHGTGDDNVHYQSAEMLISELVKHNKLFSFMAYPMCGHSLYERPNTSLHLRRTMEDYWLKNLRPGGE
ncbi:S9 family peptidase [Carboxylicivirga sp. M1479]|uniref:S9 family peptidase n=1 Tax=Carboxylicivirga sp. M1479 TaxID=2594476 RepID=UPI0011777B82|nr:S9 family peptidase [Carboxylicivirga sp. M1479]TRX70878.1 S9 family peptidase [Carboxylicivirga sp. M1479]